MEKRAPKKVTITEREYKKLKRDRLVLHMLTDAINETRAEDELVLILKYANITSTI